MYTMINLSRTLLVSSINFHFLSTAGSNLLHISRNALLKPLIFHRQSNSRNATMDYQCTVKTFRVNRISVTLLGTLRYRQVFYEYQRKFLPHHKHQPPTAKSQSSIMWVFERAHWCAMEWITWSEGHLTINVTDIRIRSTGQFTSNI